MKETIDESILSCYHDEGKTRKETNKNQASQQANNNNNKNLSSGAAELVHAAAGSGALPAIQMQP